MASNGVCECCGRKTMDLRLSLAGINLVCGNCAAVELRGDFPASPGGTFSPHGGLILPSHVNRVIQFSGVFHTVSFRDFSGLEHPINGRFISSLWRCNLVFEPV